MDIKYIYLIVGIIYYLIGTVILCNFLFNPNLDLTIVNTKTKEERKPTNRFLLFYSLLWVITIPATYIRGNKNG